MTYPADCLLPQPTYRLLTPADVPAGWLVRRTSGEAVFREETDGRVLLADINQLCDPAKQLPEGFSVNLLGQFEVAHAGWVVSREAAPKIRIPWFPPEPTEAPTAEEMGYLPPAEWGVFGLAIEHLHGRWLTVPAFGDFCAFVCHAPNCWNYWHYEVRFHNQAGQWVHEVHDPKLFSNNGFKQFAAALRIAVQEAALPQPAIKIGARVPLPRALYDSQL